MSSPSHPSFNIVVVGNGGVGKTAFIKRHRTGEFEKRYIPTNGVGINNLLFHTSVGKVEFTIWDCAGQEMVSGLPFDKYDNISGAIVMFDTNSLVSYNSVSYWCDTVKSQTRPNIPLVICGSKVDCMSRSVSQSDIGVFTKKKIQYYDISAKSNMNFEKPFLYLIRKLLGKYDIRMIESPALLPSESQTKTCKNQIKDDEDILPPTLPTRSKKNEHLPHEETLIPTITATHQDDVKEVMSYLDECDVACEVSLFNYWSEQASKSSK